GPAESKFRRDRARDSTVHHVRAPDAPAVVRAVIAVEIDPGPTGGEPPIDDSRSAGCSEASARGKCARESAVHLVLGSDEAAEVRTPICIHIHPSTPASRPQSSGAEVNVGWISTPPDCEHATRLSPWLGPEPTRRQKSARKSPLKSAHAR